MRVLYLNPFSREVSGPDESLRTLLAALVPLGVDAHVVLPEPGPQVPRYEALGAKVHFAPMTILSRRPGLGATMLPFRFGRGALAISRIARSEAIDLIHSNMEVVLDGAVASRLLGLPHVLHYRGNTNDDPAIVFDILTRFWTATAEKIFCISNATAEIFRKRGVAAKVETLYNAVDLQAFGAAERSDDVRHELGAESGDVLIGTVGRIHPRKDVATFLRTAAEIARRCPEARFAVVGSAEAPEEIVYEAELRKLARELGVSNRVTWSGARRDMPRVMKALDVFVLCSRNEGFGRVVAEAMAAGTPCIVSDEGAPPELLGPEAADFCALPTSPADFAAKTLRLVLEPARREEARVRGVIRAAMFAKERVAKQIYETYLSLRSGV